MIGPYLDKYCLVAPRPVSTTERGSDNGVLFSAQYIMQGNTNLSILPIFACIDNEGNLRRVPNDPPLDAADDHYGALAVMNYLGVYKKIKLPYYLWLHLPLWKMLLAARGNPLHYLLSPLVALIIATSGMRNPVSDTGNRMLAWTMIQGVQKSFLCRLAGRIWTSRINRNYSKGMYSVASIYFGPEHPIAKYWY